MNEITPAELDSWQKLCDAATPLDDATIARYDHGGGRVYVGELSGERELIMDLYGDGSDREFYINSRTAMPRLIAEVRRLREKRDQQRNNADSLVQAINRSGYDLSPCTGCGVMQVVLSGERVRCGGCAEKQMGSEEQSNAE